MLATAFPAGGGPPADPAGLADVAPLTRAPGVTGHSGPFPVAFPVLRANGHADAVLAEGRGSAAAPVDQPELTEGSWVRNGEVVVERSFADALGIHAGDRVTLNGRPFTVAGVAVTAALPTSGIGFLEGSTQWPNPGLIWLTEAAARSLATPAQPLGYILNLKLANPAGAEAFANRFTASGSYTNNTGSPFLIPWQEISRQDGLAGQGRAEHPAGGELAAGPAGHRQPGHPGRRPDGRAAPAGRPAEGGRQHAGPDRQRAAGRVPRPRPGGGRGRPGGRTAGRAAADQPGRRLFSALPVLRSSPSATVGIVVAVALAVAAVATFFPAIRAARTSTVSALADAARQPRRRGWLIARSARLPVPLLLAVRVAARRPRRIVLSALSIAVTVSGIVAVLFAHATLAVVPIR